MDNDLRPFRSNAASEPKQAPMIEPTPPAPAPDPFKPDQTPVSSGKVKHHSGGKFKKFLMIVLILVVLGGAGYGIYYWQHQQVDALAKQNQGLTAEVEALQTEVSNLKAETSTLTAEVEEAPTADELVMTSAKLACEATIDPTSKKALIYTQGTSGTEKKNVLYSADKIFATTSAVCATTANATNPAQTFYLKKVGETWVFLYSGTTADPAMTTKYGIPATFS